MDLLREVEHLIASGRLVEASEALNRHVEKCGTSWQVAFYMALLSAYSGDEGLALQQYNLCLEMNPSLKHVHYVQALLKQQKNYFLIQFLQTVWAEYKKIRQADSMIISYPKCGRTWLRLLISRVLDEKFSLNVNEKDALELEMYPDFNDRIPRIVFTHDDHPHWIRHESISSDKSAYLGKNVIFLMRDPRDVVVSYYFQYTLRGDKKNAHDFDFDKTIDEFAFHNIGGIPSIVKFYNAWCENGLNPNHVLFLSYEDLHAKTSESLHLALNHLGIAEVENAYIDNAVNFCQFEKMRSYEESNKFNYRLSTREGADPNAYKTRRGKIGGFRDYLSEETIDKINNYLRRYLSDKLSIYKQAA